MSTRQAELGEFGFAGDDRVVPFQVEGLDVRGRAVQLGPLINTILDRHAYPAPVARLLAEFVDVNAGDKRFAAGQNHNRADVRLGIRARIALGFGIALGLLAIVAGAALYGVQTGSST